MSTLLWALMTATALCAGFAASVRVEVPGDVPAPPELVAEAPLPEPDATRSECEDARSRALTYLAALEEDTIDYDARRWIGQGFRAIHCAPPWPTREDPQLACPLGGCSVPASRGLGHE